jgi:hypothetical protein
MARQGVVSLALYPEGQASEGPTTELVFNAFEGLRRHRLLDVRGEALRRFHDELPTAGREVLELLDIAVTSYGLT